jgi:hypothetical protein
MNRHELVASMNQATTELLREKGFVSFVDVLIRMGKLTKEDHDAWRMRRLPYLERAIRLNLNQLSHLLRTLRQNAVNGKLKPSKTVYVSWGKGGKQRLQFSKSGHPRIEEAYATHFVKQDQGGSDNASDSSGRDPKVAEPVNYRTAVISAEANDMMDSGQGEPFDLLG